jgi:osmotically inducible protein OsmC
MTSLYCTRVVAKGGRYGSVQSEDGLLDRKLAMLKAIGGSGGATKTEQIVCCGIFSCFENA